ncbi:unnamed protein product [Sphagnum tenellum]
MLRDDEKLKGLELKGHIEIKEHPGVENFFFRLSKSRSVFTTGEEEAVVVEDKQVHEKDDEVDMIVAGRRDVGNVELFMANIEPVESGEESTLSGNQGSKHSMDASDCEKEEISLEVDVNSQKEAEASGQRHSSELHGRESYEGDEEFAATVSSGSIPSSSQIPDRVDIEFYESLNLSCGKEVLSPRLISAHSFDGSGVFPAPMGSPLLQKGKEVLPAVSPELMELIDSAIEGTDQVNLQKLRRVVCGEEELVLEAEANHVDQSIASCVVNVLIAKMGGVDGLDDVGEESAPRVMLSPGAAVVAGELLAWLPCKLDEGSSMSPRTRMVKALARVLRACTRNRAMCAAAGLLQVLLSAAPSLLNGKLEQEEELEVELWDSSPFLDAIEALGSHRVTVLDLRQWLGAAAETSATGKSLDLILTLERAMSGEEIHGPSHSFEFDGESSGLLGPGESKWPFGTGFAFVTWLYIESFADTVNTAAAAAAIAAVAAAKSGKSSAMSAAAAASALAGEGTAHMPRLFSFLSVDNLGIEAYFHGQFLVVESVNGKGRKASLHFTYPFKPRCWYFIGLEHTHRQSILGKLESEMKLYVDGRLYESRPLAFPRLSRPLGFCCIGTNPPPAIAGLQRRRRQCPLFAEMGPVYIFKEALGSERMADLAARGGDALPSFGAGAGTPWFANNEQAMSAAEDSAALDVEIGPRLHLLYHPKLLNGHSCPDASPEGASGMHRKPAQVLGEVHVAARIRPTEAIWAMAEGGPMVLLPFTVGAVDKDTLQPLIGKADVSSSTMLHCAPIFRMLSVSLQHAGNAEEIARSYAPRLLAYILGYLVSAPSPGDPERKAYEQARTEERDEELVAAVVSLARAPQNHTALKVQLFRSLLLDLKLWISCSYGVQKKLLSQLADMVFTEAPTMRGASAVQMLLDGCRRCYWLIPESDSIHTFAGGKSSRPAGELNALVDELLVVIELLLGSATGSSLGPDVCSVVQFVLDCPQHNQVARVLHLIYRLVVQPNTARAAVFAEALLVNGGVEMLLTLLRREAESQETLPNLSSSDLKGNLEFKKVQSGSKEQANAEQEASDGHVDIDIRGVNSTAVSAELLTPQPLADSLVVKIGGDHRQLPLPVPEVVSAARSRSTALKLHSAGSLGGIALSISADTVRNKFRNVDMFDGIMVGIVSLLGALVARGHLKVMSFALAAKQPLLNSSGSGITLSREGSPGVVATSVVWLVYALEKAFQAAPRKCMTDNVYAALLPAAASLSENRLALYDAGHRFEHIPLLLVLLRSLPFASKQLQLRALQDMLLLACTHAENRNLLTTMPEWPEWLLEILISNYETGISGVAEEDGSCQEIEDLVYSFLTIMLEHSMRLKDGWKDVEATIHCAEWLIMTGGSSYGEGRVQWEELVPVIKRKLLGNLLDFAASELQLQTQVVAAAAAGVAAEGLSPRTAKAEAEAVASLCMSLAENALVLLMLVEDHLRVEMQAFIVSLTTRSAAPVVSSSLDTLQVLQRSFEGVDSFGSRQFSSSGFDVVGGPFENSHLRKSLTASDTGSLSLEILASMADENGQVSAAAMERLAASAAAEPYESVRCAFACYGTCGLELAEGWKRRSRLWYGVGLPQEGSFLGGGGDSFETWESSVERDADGQWIDLPLVRKSTAMLQALLLDEYGPGAGGGGIVGFGSGAGMGSGGAQLHQLLDSDQPFFAMLRIVLLALREEDEGEPPIEVTTLNKTGSLVVGSSRLQGRARSPSDQWMLGSDIAHDMATRRAKSSLLWCVLAPLLTMQLFESRRQRVLVTACILYSEVWHAVSEDRKVLRKRYLETILPPFAALLRRWRPLLSGIHELTDSQGQSPLAVEDRPLATDALPLEAALAMISPAWAAAFASPPAAMALAMAAAGVGGGESFHQRNNYKSSDWRSSGLLSLSTFQKAPDTPVNTVSPTVKDKAAMKASALAAAREQERAARVGLARGLGAAAMASSVQRRALTDKERERRWNISNIMDTAWLQHDPESENTGKDSSGLTHWTLGILPIMMETARKMHIREVNRRAMVTATDEFGLTVGARVWRSLVRRLQEMDSLFGIIASQIRAPQRVFWKLDLMENSLRMRKRLKRNYKGTDHHGAALDYQESEQSPTATISSGDTPLPAGAPKLQPEEDAFEEPGEYELRDQEDSEEERSEKSMKGFGFNTRVSPQTSVAAALAAEPKDKVILEIPAAMVQPLRVVRGRFQVTTRRICFMIDDHVHMNKEVVASLLEEEDDWELVEGSTEREDTDYRVQQIQQCKEGAKDRLWPLSALREVHSRRFSLRRSALELFMVDRSNFFFNFGTVDARQRVHRAIVQAQPPHLSLVYAGTQRPEQLLRRSQLMERWARWEISNFEYLMQLNTLAGRTYNDITQYPVFPWILADYTCEVLDLSNPTVFRDLSKPIGALNPARLEKFVERYENFDDPVIPKFHYGSHYSSVGTVLYYLVRIEPYSTLAIQLQGGRFDHADRMFFDIASTWNGVCEDMSNVKELIPELFYMPEALTNENQIDLGWTQKGEKLGNVKLPPWASSPVDFIQKHRAALESEYVSEHLHEWIDLIFGYKQQGAEAVAAHNVFFYMTYEGTVDIDKIADPVLRKATQDQITYFGQTPSQLLTTPHIRRMPLSEVLHLQTVFRNPKATKAYAIPGFDRLNVPAIEVRTTHDSIVTVDMEVPACHVAVHRWQANTPDGRGMPFLFQHGVRSNLSASNGGLMRMFSKAPEDNESRYPRAVALAPAGVKIGTLVAITPDGRYLLTGGHADNSLKVVATNTAHAVESALGHCSPITCLALSPEGSTLVTGSGDATVILWGIHGSSSMVSEGSSTMSDPSLVAAAAAASASSASDGAEASASLADFRRRHVEGPLHVLRGHVNELVCCCVNADLDLVVSSSHTKGVLLHSITHGRFLRQLPIGRADMIALSPEGIIVVFDKASRVLQAFTVNGVQIAVKVLPSWEGDISSIVISKDGLHAVIGTSCSRTHISSEKKLQNAKSISNSDNMHHSREHFPHTDVVSFALQVIQKFVLKKNQDITAMTLNSDNTNLVVSTSDSQLLVFTDPALSIKVVDQMLQLGWEGDGLSAYL